MPNGSASVVPRLLLKMCAAPGFAHQVHVIGTTVLQELKLREERPEPIRVQADLDLIRRRAGFGVLILDTDHHGPSSG